MSKNRGFTVNPHFIQEIAAMSFQSEWRRFIDHIGDPWASRLKLDDGPLNNPKKLVLRTQLVCRKDYINHLQNPEDQRASGPQLSRNNAALLRKGLPEQFWITEFTCPEVFSVHSAKLGEVLLKFAPSDEDKARFYEGHNSICFGFRLINYSEFETREGDTKTIELRYNSHSPLYKRKNQIVKY